MIYSTFVHGALLNCGAAVTSATVFALCVYLILILLLFRRLITPACCLFFKRYQSKNYNLEVAMTLSSYENLICSAFYL